MDNNNSREMGKDEKRLYHLYLADESCPAYDGFNEWLSSRELVYHKIETVDLTDQWVRSTHVIQVGAEYFQFECYYSVFEQEEIPYSETIVQVYPKETSTIIYEKKNES